MSRCKFCEQNGVITEGEWQKTQYGNRLFVNGEQHKCPYYVKKPTPTAPAPGVIQSRENSNTYIPPGYVQTPSSQVQQIPTPQPSTVDPAALEQIVTRLDGIDVKLSTVWTKLEMMNENVDKMLKMVQDMTGDR